MRRLPLALLVIGTATLLSWTAAADDAASALPPADVRLIRGKPLDEWVRALHHKDPEVRAAAAEALGDAGRGALDVLPALHAALIDPEAHDAVFHALLRVDPKVQTSVKVFVAELHAGDEKVRARGVHHLMLISELQPQAVLAAMADALHDKSERVRVWASYTIADFGAKALPVAPALIEALHDESAEVRAVAAGALGDLRPAAARAAVPLCHAMRDRDECVRREALHALCNLHPEEKAVVSILLDNLNDPDQDIRLDNAIVLAHMRPELAIKPLCDALASPDSAAEAAAALGEIGPGARTAVPALLLVLKGRHEFARRMAADALKKIDPDAAAHVLPKEP